MFQVQIHPWIPVSIVCVVPGALVSPQVHVQFHVQTEGTLAPPVVTGTGCAGVAVWVRGASADAGDVAAAVPPAGGAVSGAAVCAAASAVLVCVTGPSAPGLAIRTDTATFVGATWDVPAFAEVACAVSAVWAAVWAASPCAAIVCVTAPLSPGLSIRTDTSRFAAPSWEAAASAAATAWLVSGGVGAVTVGTGDGEVGGASSARAGIANPSASAEAARLATAMRRAGVIPRPPLIATGQEGNTHAPLRICKLR
jgi:hypothetical protein